MYNNTMKFNSRKQNDMENRLVWWNCLVFFLNSTDFNVNVIQKTKL